MVVTTLPALVCTVTHIISDGQFWDFMEKDYMIKEGMVVYTNGFLWCNTSPNWTWKGGRGAKRLIRCRIELPENTQIVVDRSPVHGGTECQFDDKRTSVFPDVLLSPGEFQITSVTRYQTEKDDSESDDSADDDDQADGMVQTVIPKQYRKWKSIEINDEEYAAHILTDVSKFVDVRLKVTKMMRLPSVESVK